MDNKSSEALDLAPKIFWHHHIKDQYVLNYQQGEIGSWLTGVIYFFFSGSETNRKDYAFLDFYLENTKLFCFQFMSVHIILLFGSVFIILCHHLTPSAEFELDATFLAFQPAAVDILVWIALSLLCWGFFCLLIWAPNVFVELYMEGPHEAWFGIGAAILLTRVLILVGQITYLARSEVSGAVCMDTQDLIGSGVSCFGYSFIKMSIDTYQTFAFAVLPFPQPWTLLLVLVELTRQLIRIETCRHLISTDPDLQWISQMIIFLLLQTYLTLVLVPSMYLEGSFRNRFRSLELQRRSDYSKREMVGFLSTDVRVPLQYLLHVVATVDFTGIAGRNVQPLLNDIHAYSGTVNDIADELLLLVRIKEKRYTSRLSPVADLCALLDGTVTSFMRRRLANGAADAVSTGSLQDCYINVQAQSLKLNVDEKCVLVVLRHLLVFITQVHTGSNNATAGAGGMPPRQTSAVDNESAGEDLDLFSTGLPQDRIEMHLSASVEEIPGAPPATSMMSSSILTVVLTGDAALKEGWDETQRVREATTCYICAAVAAACSGQFLYSDFKYVLTIPCTLPLSDNSRTVIAEAMLERSSSPVIGSTAVVADDGIESVGGASLLSNARSYGTALKHTEEARRLDQAELDIKLKVSVAMQEQFKRSRVCAIVADAVLESVITNAIARMHLAEGLSVMRELQVGDYVPIAMITFVTSYELCVELRVRGYEGKIVLFSGSVNYLDDEQVANVDYCLPLPCADSHIGQFVDWLVSVHEKQKIDRAATTAATAKKKEGIDANLEVIIPAVNPASTPDSVGFSFKHCVAALLGMVKSSYAAFRWYLSAIQSEFAGIILWMRDCIYYMAAQVVSKELWFGVARLPPGTVESYTKWKKLNPSGSWYHQSTEIFITVMPRVLMEFIVEIFFFRQTLFVVIGALLVGILVLSAPMLYKYIITPMGWRFSYFWIIPGSIIFIIYTALTLIDLFRERTEENMSISEFLNAHYEAGVGGNQQLYSQVMTVTNSRMFAIFYPQPLNLLIVCILFIRCTQINWLVMRSFVSVQYCMFTQLLFVQLSALNFAYLSYLENAYRREFMVSYQHILDRAFLEQCLDICQQDIRKPLEYLLARKEDLMKVVQHAAQSRAFVIDLALMSQLEPLRVAKLLLSEAVNHFGYSRYFAPIEEDAAPVRPELEAVQLSRMVSQIVSGFSSTLEDHHVRITAEVDNALAVVRVDWKMLSSILTNLVAAALCHIRDYCIETPRNEDLVSHIFLKFTAVVPPESEKLPFVHPRLMLVNVCDSSNYAAKACRQSTVDEASLKEIHSVVDQSAAQQSIFQYGRSMCEKLVHKVSMAPVFETISAGHALGTVQRFTFPYHLSSQTWRAQEFIEKETDQPHVTICVTPSAHLATYQRIVKLAAAKGQVKEKPAMKSIVMLSFVDPKLKQETYALVSKVEAYGWRCSVKYLLRLPSMHAIGAADCVLVDQALGKQEGISVCDVVLKLRVCGFNGVIALLVHRCARGTEALCDDIAKSAAAADVVLYAPLGDREILTLTVAIERKVIRQALYMNGN